MARDFLTLHRVKEHYNESLNYFNENQIIGIFLQGSQNYGLELPTSDVDTKLIVVPSFEDIVLNRKPISTTHIRENEEHIDFKDIRLYMETFKKQNLNFLEILFTLYAIVNDCYYDDWYKLYEAREEIARMNPYRAVKSMKGIAMEKWHAMEHEYPSKVEVLAKHGYDPKQLHHLLRVEDYLERYIAGESYESCLRPSDPGYLMDIKIGVLTLDEARRIGQKSIEHVIDIADRFCEKQENVEDKEVRALLEEVQTAIMKKAILNELL